jgi:hypothetical protein
MRSSEETKSEEREGERRIRLTILKSRFERHTNGKIARYRGKEFKRVQEREREIVQESSRE